MVHWFLVMALMIGAAYAPAAAQTNWGNPDDEPYDEWAESPTVFLEGCGEFPAVRVMVNGEETDSRGFIRRGRTYLPAREALTRLGGSVTWVQRQQAFYASFPQRDRTIRVSVGNPTVDIYRLDTRAQYGAGQRVSSVSLGAAPILCEGRVFAPVRPAVEAVGGTVSYDRTTRTVTVRAPRSGRS